MTRNLFLIAPAISVLFLAFGIFQSDSEAQVREVHSILLNDLGVARLDRQGNPYVTINPVRCRQLGPELCEFFRQHEYGHVNLKHLERRINPRQAEIEADCYAAKNVSPDVAKAASDWFNSGNGASRVHGSSQQRADRVTSCSQKAQPIRVPNRSQTRRPVVASKKSYASNASPNSQTRRAVPARSNSASSPRPAKLVYAKNSTPKRTTIAKKVYVKSPTTVRVTAGPTKRAPATKTAIRPTSSTNNKPNCRCDSRP